MHCVLATGFLMGSGTQLSARICYPLSRLQRAQLTYLGTAIDAVTFFGITAVLIYISDAVPLPQASAVTLRSARWAQAPATPS